MIISESSFKALGFMAVIALASAGCGDGDEVKVPTGVERVTFKIRVLDGGVSVPTGTAASFSALAYRPDNGNPETVDAEISVGSHGPGRSDVTYTFSAPITGESEDAQEQILQFSTFLTLGENGEAEGVASLDSTLPISQDGKTVFVNVVFDLSNPYPNGDATTASLYNMFKSRSAGEQRTLLASLSRTDEDENLRTFDPAHQAGQEETEVQVAL